MGEITLTASGALKDTSFSELLVYFVERGLSGALVLEAPSREKHALSFLKGELIRVQVNSPNTRLGSVLLALEGITKEDCQRAEQEPQAGLFGQRLLAGGLAEGQLQWGLHEQFLRQMEFLSGLPGETAFGYYQDVELLSGWGGDALDVDCLAAIWASVRRASASSRVLQAYASISSAKLRLHRSSRISRFGFQAKERAVLDVLRVQPQYLRDLRETQLATDGLLQRLVYVLVITGHLDVGKPPLSVANPKPCYMPQDPSAQAEAPACQAKSLPTKPATAPPSAVAESRSPVAMSQSPISGLSADDEQRDSTATAQFLVRQEIEKRAEILDEMSAYDLLEVPSDCSSAEIARAFSRLAKRWHPDRLSPPCADLKELVTRVFSKITEARGILSNPERRRLYDEEIEGPVSDEEQREVERILQAAAVFQKAEIMVRKRDMKKAEQLALKASEADPNQPEYQALYAWIRTKRADCSEADLKQLVVQLKGAALRQKENVRIRYYLGTALKRAGDKEAALREFRFVAAHDPSNLDAVREIRLHSMRSPDERASSGGFLGRLFKR